MKRTDLMKLGRDINRSKMIVLREHGFSNEEIARVMRISVEIVNRELEQK